MQVVRPEEHLRLWVREEQVLHGRQNEQTVVGVENYLDQVREELFEQATGIGSLLEYALLIHEDNLDVLPQIRNLAQLSISILKDHVPLDLDDMLGLTGALTLHIHRLREKESPDLKRDALRHVSHDQFDIVGNCGAVALQRPLPVDAIDVPLGRI